MKYLSKDFIVYGKNGDSRRNMDYVSEHVKNISKIDREYSDKRNIIEKEYSNSEMDALASLTRFEKLDELERQTNQKRKAHAKEELLNSNRDLRKQAGYLRKKKTKKKRKH